MNITDKEGKKIEVTNLDLALMQADDYRHFRHTDPTMAGANERLQAYWEHFYQQLLNLKNSTL